MTGGWGGGQGAGLPRDNFALSPAPVCFSSRQREEVKLRCVLRIRTVLELAYLTLPRPVLELQTPRTHFFPFIQITETLPRETSSE